MIKIITDSSSNITPQEAKELGIILMPLTINFGKEEFRDGIDINCDEFYKKLAVEKEFPHTSQLTEEQIEKSVREALNEADEVLILPIAAALSGSYERCAAVAQKFKNVYVYETKCTTVMLKMLVCEAVKNAQKSAVEVIKILENLRPKIKLFAVLDTLENLRKGGRLSGAAAILGSMLKIKPVITISPEGKVELISKQFGMQKGLSFVSGAVDINKIDFNKPVYLIYTANPKNSDLLISKLKIEYSEKSNICPVIGTHIGADAAGIVYAEK